MKQTGLILLFSAFAWAQAPKPGPAAPPVPPAPPAPSFGYDVKAAVAEGLRQAQEALATAGVARDDAAYQRGQNALENRRWEEALQAFNQVVNRNGPRTDGAYYWKGYALMKLNRRDEAQAAIGDLRQKFPQSRWLDDAKALELEIRQATGQNVSPDSESDEELKLLALNGLMHNDPDRAVPSIENLLKTGSPKLKRNAVFVLAQSDAPKATQLLEQTARGGGNPDLQALAIRYYAQQKRNQAKAGQLLWEVYSGSNDVNVQRETLSAFSMVKDRDHLLQIAKSDKTTDNRATAIRTLIGMREPGDTFVQLYGAEQDAKIKQVILSSLSGQRDAKSLVGLARAEKDAKLKTEIVRQLSNMKTPEASDYLMEILK